MTSSAAVQIQSAAKPALRFSPKALLGALLARVIQADQKYRFSRRAGEVEDRILDDMGITRRDIDRALDNWPRF